MSMLELITKAIADARASGLLVLPEYGGCVLVEAITGIKPATSVKDRITKLQICTHGERYDIILEDAGDRDDGDKIYEALRVLLRMTQVRTEDAASLTLADGSWILKKNVTAVTPHLIEYGQEAGLCFVNVAVSTGSAPARQYFRNRELRDQAMRLIRESAMESGHTTVSYGQIVGHTASGEPIFDLA